VARFELKDDGGGRTTIVFDHTGFPPGRGQHLAEGWHKNYWEPMKALFERRGDHDDINNSWTAAP
jgi:hypothetical protein